MRRATIVAAVLLGAVSAVHAAPVPHSPQALVQAFYAQSAIPVGAAQAQRFLARDLAKAIVADNSTPGEVGVIDEDYRYDAQDFRISGLAIRTLAQDARTAQVEARFRNFGKAGAVRYRLCARGPGIWKIADVTPASGSIRARLGLAAGVAPGRC